jgi:hypothetical protein
MPSSQKDAQQAGVVRRMARDVKFPVDVRICPIVREEDGLAMSSRNAYLSPDERRAATVLYRSLCRAAALILEGERQAARVRQAALDLIRTEPLAHPEYLEIVDTRDFQPVVFLRGEALIAGVHQETRLIDNLPGRCPMKSLRRPSPAPAGPCFHRRTGTGRGQPRPGAAPAAKAGDASRPAGGRGSPESPEMRAPAGVTAGGMAAGGGARPAVSGGP